jgi:hypothetical protein
VDFEPSHEDRDAWHPYPTKLIFLLDTIDNLPRIRISSALMKALLWLLEELGVKNVPSFTALKKIQMNIRESVGIPTIHCKSSKGNAFSFNDPRALIANVSGIFLLKQKTPRLTRIRMLRIGQTLWFVPKFGSTLSFQQMVSFLKSGMPTSGGMI